MSDHYLSNDGNTDPLTSYDILNFNIEFDENMVTYKADDGKTRISPTKAAKAFMSHYDILAAEGSNVYGKIWIYNTKKGIYTPNGVKVISYILEELGGDLSTPQIENKVVNYICNHRPFEMSKFDPNPYLVCVRNGVFDLQNSKFLRHSPKYLMTKMIDVQYDPIAKCIKFDKFLDDVVEHEDDKNTIYDFAAATLIRKPFDVFLSLIGGGRNGKGRLILFMRWFFGEDNVTSVPIDRLGSRFQSLAVYRKLLIINGEFEGNFPIRAVKDITSGNPIQAEIKNGGTFDFTPYAKVMFDTNNPPKINDSSEGRIRRHYKLDFTKRFVDNPNGPNERKRDPDILSKLQTEEEKSGLFNALIPRAKALIEGGTIYRRKTEQQTIEEYEIQTHSVSAFVDNWCELDDPYGASNTFTYSSELYASYKKFCAAYNTPPKTQKSLGMYLASLGYRATREGPKRNMAYKGIKIKPIVQNIPDCEKAIV